MGCYHAYPVKLFQNWQWQTAGIFISQLPRIRVVEIKRKGKKEIRQREICAHNWKMDLEDLKKLSITLLSPASKRTQLPKKETYQQSPFSNYLIIKKEIRCIVYGLAIHGSSCTRFGKCFQCSLARNISSTSLIWQFHSFSSWWKWSIT